MEALLAAKRYPEMLRLLSEAPKGMATVAEQVRLYELAGEPAEADAAVQDLLRQISSEAAGALRTTVEASIRAVRAAAHGDEEGYLRSAESAVPAGSSMCYLLRGDLAGAETAVQIEALNSAEPRALILLATPPADAGKVAAAKKALLEALDTTDRERKQFKELLQRGSNDPVRAIRELLILPEQNRVFAAAAAVWFPDHVAELSALSRELDIHHDAVSLVLAKYR